MAAGRTTFLFTALALLTVVLFTADLLIGSVAVAPADIWAALTGGDCDPAIRDIILRIRLLKAVTALLAGAALAASGLQMQTLFRNPLAGPYVLGISSGAGLGVALFLLGAPLLGVSAHSFVQSLGIAGAAWLGCHLAVLEFEGGFVTYVDGDAVGRAGRPPGGFLQGVDGEDFIALPHHGDAVVERIGLGIPAGNGFGAVAVCEAVERTPFDDSVAVREVAEPRFRARGRRLQPEQGREEYCEPLHYSSRL